MLLIVNLAVHRLFGWAAATSLGVAVRALPFAVEALVAVLVADLVQYWIHRAYHEVPWLWRFHAVHHSAKVLDWMAGSRLHLVELLTTRIAILGVLYAVGFSKEAIDVYIVVVGFQAVFNHSNARVPWRGLERWIVAPRFHHWHHSSDREAFDRNYAAHFAFLDTLFGTRVETSRELPESYGILGEEMPAGFARQQIRPFVRRD